MGPVTLDKALGDSAVAARTQHTNMTRDNRRLVQVIEGELQGKGINKEKPDTELQRHTTKDGLQQRGCSTF
jgi:hypothetical protein